jgi:hypothetical protein
VRWARAGTRRPQPTEPVPLAGYQAGQRARRHARCPDDGRACHGRTVREDRAGASDLTQPLAEPHVDAGFRKGALDDLARPGAKFRADDLAGLDQDDPGLAAGPGDGPQPGDHLGRDLDPGEPGPDHDGGTPPRHLRAGLQVAQVRVEARRGADRVHVEQVAGPGEARGGELAAGGQDEPPVAQGRGAPAGGGGGDPPRIRVDAGHGGGYLADAYRAEYAVQPGALAVRPALVQPRPDHQVTAGCHHGDPEGAPAGPGVIAGRGGRSRSPDPRETPADDDHVAHVIHRCSPDAGVRAAGRRPSSQ